MEFGACSRIFVPELGATASGAGCSRAISSAWLMLSRGTARAGCVGVDGRFYDCVSGFFLQCGGCNVGFANCGLD